MTPKHISRLTFLTCVSCSLAIGALASQTARANLLTDGDFSAASTFDYQQASSDNTLVPGWQLTVYPSDNQYAYYGIIGPSGSTNQDANGQTVAQLGGSGNALEIMTGTFQTSAVDRPAVTPGEALTLSFDWALSGNVYDSSQVFLDFYSNNTAGNYTPLSSSSAFYLPNLNSGQGAAVGNPFEEFSFSDTVPTGASYVGVRVVQHKASYDYTEVYDNFDLTGPAPTPEPTAWLLLGAGAGGLVLAARRRRVS
jgi:hypothetical protein